MLKDLHMYRSTRGTKRLKETDRQQGNQISKKRKTWSKTWKSELLGLVLGKKLEMVSYFFVGQTD